MRQEWTSARTLAAPGDGVAWVLMTQQLSAAQPTAQPASRLAFVLAAVARRVASPVQRLAVRRPPAIDDPAGLRPGDPPPTDGRVLILYDGGCGVCLHGRDLLAWIDRRRGRLAHDRLQRHAGGLLADLEAEAQLASWHVILADGQRYENGPSVVALLAALPFGRLTAPAARAAMPLTDRVYRWFSGHRANISQFAGLADHLDRDPPAVPDAPARH